jgi:hypothetical protein
MTSSSSNYYHSHPKARKNKNAYNTKYESTPSRIAYRQNLNKINKTKGHKGDGLDVSHKKDGSTTLEKASSNRARNGESHRRLL